MSLEINKAKSYLGFAIKSKSIRYGVDDICKLKRAELIIVSSDLQNSSLSKISNFSIKKNIEILNLSIDDFQNLLDNKSVKVLAILDANLASAIKKNLTNL